MDKNKRKCPYCGSKVSYIEALSELSTGEHTCAVCNKNSNISYSKKMYIPAAVLLGIAVIIAVLIFILGNKENLLQIFLVIIIPFAVFFFIVPLYYILSPIKSEAATPVVKQKLKSKKRSQITPRAVKYEEKKRLEKEQKNMEKKSNSLRSKFSKFVKTYIIVDDDEEEASSDSERFEEDSYDPYYGNDKKRLDSQSASAKEKKRFFSESRDDYNYEENEEYDEYDEYDEEINVDEYYRETETDTDAVDPPKEKSGNPNAVNDDVSDISHENRVIKRAIIEKEPVVEDKGLEAVPNTDIDTSDNSYESNKFKERVKEPVYHILNKKTNVDYIYIPEDDNVISVNVDVDDDDENKELDIFADIEAIEEEEQENEEILSFFESKPNDFDDDDNDNDFGFKNNDGFSSDEFDESAKEYEDYSENAVADNVLEYVPESSYGEFIELGDDVPVEIKNKNDGNEKIFSNSEDISSESAESAADLSVKIDDGFVEEYSSDNDAEIHEVEASDGAFAEADRLSIEEDLKSAKTFQEELDLSEYRTRDYVDRESIDIELNDDIDEPEDEEISIVEDNFREFDENVNCQYNENSETVPIPTSKTETEKRKSDTFREAGNYNKSRRSGKKQSKKIVVPKIEEQSEIEARTKIKKNTEAVGRSGAENRSDFGSKSESGKSSKSENKPKAKNNSEFKKPLTPKEKSKNERNEETVGFFSKIKNRLIEATEEEREEVYKQEERARKLAEKEARKKEKEREKEKEKTEQKSNDSPKNYKETSKSVKKSETAKSTKKSAPTDGNTKIFKVPANVDVLSVDEQEKIVLESVKDTVTEMEKRKISEAEKVKIIADKHKEEKRQEKTERLKAEQEKKRVQSEQQQKAEKLRKERQQKAEQIRFKQAQKAKERQERLKKSTEERDMSNVKLTEVDKVKTKVSQQREQKKRQVSDFFGD